MIKWNEQRLEELVRKMGLERSHGCEQSPIHLSLYVSPWGGSVPFLTQVMILDTNEWATLGYAETDRVSAVQCLGSLKCRTEGALYHAASNQQPLTLELAKLLIDAGAFDKDALSAAARCQSPLTLELAKLLIDAGAFDKYALRWAAERQRPLTLELAKLLIDAGCDPAAQYDNSWDSLVWLAVSGHPVDPQVTDLFLSAGCRTNLDGCSHISDGTRLRFDQILKEHAEWKEGLSRMSAENSLTGTFYGPDWSR